MPDYNLYVHTCLKVNELIKSSSRENLIKVFDELKININEHDNFDVLIMLSRIENYLSINKS